MTQQNRIRLSVVLLFCALHQFQDFDSAKKAWIQYHREDKKNIKDGIAGEQIKLWETQNHIQMRQNQAHIFVRDFNKLVCKIKEVCALE